jgi:hypothetical protein
MQGEIDAYLKTMEAKLVAAKGKRDALQDKAQGARSDAEALRAASEAPLLRPARRCEPPPPPVW